MIDTERLLLRKPTAADVEDPPAFLSDPRVISLIVPDNLPSQRVAQRLGATPGEAIELPGYGQHVVWVHPR